MVVKQFRYDLKRSSYQTLLSQLVLPIIQREVSTHQEVDLFLPSLGLIEKDIFSGSPDAANS